MQASFPTFLPSFPFLFHFLSFPYHMHIHLFGIQNEILLSTCNCNYRIMVVERIVGYSRRGDCRLYGWCGWWAKLNRSKADIFRIKIYVWQVEVKKEFRCFCKTCQITFLFQFWKLTVELSSTILFVASK